MDPKHNLYTELIATGEFLFAEGATTAAEALAIGYRHFGNIAKLGIKPERAMEDHYGNYRGIRKKDGSYVKEAKLTYALTLDEWTHQNLAVLFAASQGASYTQAAETLYSDCMEGQAAISSPTSCDQLTFSEGNPSGTTDWYYLSVSGHYKRALLTCTITGKVEDTDFEVDYDKGCIRFLIDQTASLTPKITCVAKDAITLEVGRWYTPTFGGAERRVWPASASYFRNSGGDLIELTPSDYDYDQLTGRVRFTSTTLPGESDFNIRIGAAFAEVLAGADAGFVSMTPLAVPILSGYGRLTVFDQDNTDIVVLDHQDFACQISAESAGDIDGQKVSEMTFKVDVQGSDAGTMLVRNKNNN